MSFNHSTSFARARRAIISLLVVAGCAGAVNAEASGVTISGSPPQSAIVGKAYAFTPTATDSSGRRYWFSIRNKPVWANFSPWSGKLSGTPAASNIGTSSNIEIKVSDGHTTAHLAAFAITVTAAQAQPPTISGTPPTSVTAGSPYSFQPVANSNGLPVSFSIVGKPAWASFNSTTGQLNGTPTAAQDGTYSGIVISVGDTAGSAALAPFAITVSGGTTPTTGTATVTWVAPTQNSDGSALTNLAGYEVDYGTSASALNQTVKIANSAQTSYAITNLTSGTWYFAAGSKSSSPRVVGGATP